jgi:uncharacterized membrane protein YeiB
MTTGLADPGQQPVRDEFVDPVERAIHESRLIGPDVVRAVALIGVVLMNFHGYLIIEGGEQADNLWGRFFNPWDGPLSTRFAATFVLTAGVGVTLLTRSAIGDPAAVSARRWTLVRRGLLLWGFGELYYEIWPGSILPFYGAMFFIAAFMFTLATPVVLGVGVGSALAAAGIGWWATERKAGGHATTWLFNPGSNSPRGHLFDLFVNRTHPLLPWLAFFCAGILLGRALRTDWWRPITIGVGFTLFGVATLIGSAFENPTELTAVMTDLDPDGPGRSLPYVASALGTALIAFAVISWVAERFRRSRLTQILAHAGQMTLTLYIAHGVVFNFIVHWMGWVEPAGLDLALVFTACYWVAAIALGSLWHQRFRIGPAERLYRKLGG